MAEDEEPGETELAGAEEPGGIGLASDEEPGGIELASAEEPTELDATGADVDTMPLLEGSTVVEELLPTTWTVEVLPEVPAAGLVEAAGIVDD